jgi:hypothetical protein
MDLLLPLIIHKVLPSKILAMIFEEHTELESRALLGLETQGGFSGSFATRLLSCAANEVGGENQIEILNRWFTTNWYRIYRILLRVVTTG